MTKPVHISRHLSTRSYFYATDLPDTFVKVWYDRHQRLWVSYLTDGATDDANQTSCANFDARREDAALDRSAYLTSF
jgi:hypothetical protein